MKSATCKSTSLPVEAHRPMPMPRSMACITLRPRPPPCVAKPMGPLTRSCGKEGEKVRPRRWLTLVRPVQLGPYRRIPPASAISLSRTWARSPSSPASPKPDVNTMANKTPRAAHSSATASTPDAGTTITATSGVAGSDATLGQQRCPRISALVGLTREMSSSNSEWSSRLVSVRSPMLCGRSEAPTRAIERGRISRERSVNVVSWSLWVQRCRGSDDRRETQDFAPGNQGLHFGGAFGNRPAARVAEDALDGVVGGVAQAAVHLQCHAGDFVCGLGGIELGDRAGGARIGIGVQCGGRAQAQCPSGFHADRHVHDELLN